MLFFIYFIADFNITCYTIIMKQKNMLSSKENFRALYNSYVPNLKLLLVALESDIKSNLQLISMPSYKTRVKSFDSYYRKLIKYDKLNKDTNELYLLTDMLGIRIICHFLEDIDTIQNQLMELYDVIEVEKKGAEREFSSFGYESTHILVKMPQRLIDKHITSDELDNLPKDVICEIQIRTVLQDAWAEVEHELVYKAEFSPFDLPMRRKLYSMNATLSLTEIIFQEIRDYQNKFNAELDKRRFDFYEKADVITASKLDADSVMTDSFSPKNSLKGSSSPFVKGTIDDLVLEALQAHNLGNLDKAIAIYTKILESKPEPNNIIMSVIHKHRGMAFFAQNNYENAKNDFILSTEFDPKNFRSFYYIGIVCSVTNDEKEALGYFDKSLEINNFQAHVRYRKALSFYHLGLFDQSLELLNQAIQQGLEEDEAEKLLQMLQSKLS